MLNNVKAIVDVADLTAQKYGTRDELFYCDYGTSAGIEGTSEELSIRGGQNAPIRVTYYHSKDANFTSEMPLVDIGALGAKLGREIEIGNAIAPQTDSMIVDATNGTITLSQTPLTGTLKIYSIEDNGRDRVSEIIVGDPAANATEYSISDKIVTLHEDLKGKFVRCSYDYTAGAKSRVLRMTAADVAGFMRLTGSGFGIDENGNKAPIKFIIHKLQPSPDFALNFTSGEATNVPLNGKILPEKIMVDGKVQDVFFDYIELPDEA